MSKLDILAEGREQGILLARRLVEAAQKEGRDPLEAIDNELGYRKRYKQQSRFTKKEISEAYESYREETTVTLMSIACIVLWDVFKFGGKHRLPRFLAECDVYTKALAEGSITWKDIDNVIVDKCGLDFIPEGVETMTVQELAKALSPMGYTVEDMEDVVRIVISPADFIRGAPKLQKDLEKVGWRRSFSYRASRPLTKEESEMWDRFLHPLDYLEPLAYPKMPKIKKPKRTEAKEETYIQLSLF